MFSIDDEGRECEDGRRGYDGRTGVLWLWFDKRFRGATEFDAPLAGRDGEDTGETVTIGWELTCVGFWHLNIWK